MKCENSVIDYTIITISKNDSINLKKTIQSVINQAGDMHKVEMVIVDGASTDSTADVVQEYIKIGEKKGLSIRFYSSHDNGIYDAMNKGVRYALGEWCIFLNAGDCFFDNNAIELFDSINKENSDIIYGDYVRVYNKKFYLVKAKEADDLTFMNIHGMGFSHQSAAIKKELLKQYPYSEKYVITNDFDFFVHAYKNGAKFKRINGVIALFQCDGLSSTNNVMVEKEQTEVMYNYGFIDKDVYTQRINELNRLLRIRSKTPKILVRARHNYLMRKGTKNWKTEKEIRDLIAKEFKI